jgi:hypothetical protein
VVQGRASLNDNNPLRLPDRDDLFPDMDPEDRLIFQVFATPTGRAVRDLMVNWGYSELADRIDAACKRMREHLKVGAK